MAQLDRLVSSLATAPGATILLTEDHPAELFGSGQMRPLTKHPLTARQILALMREVAPPAALTDLDLGARCTFTYPSPTGHVRVSVERATGGVRVRIDDASAVLGELPHSASVPIGTPGWPLVAVTEPNVRVVPLAESPQSKLEELLLSAVDRGASDLHLRAGEPPILRLQGELLRLEGTAPMVATQLQGMLETILPPRNAEELAERHDTDFAWTIADRARFRVNVFRDRTGIGASFRAVPVHVVTVEDLDLPPELRALAQLPSGLVLVTGPTGSGKSTTLCALVDLVNRTRSDHIVTVEDPIEFVHVGKRGLVTQREIGVHAEGFARALRAALREDPDVVLVGEMRDLATTRAAIEMAETGHLVFATLHTNTATSSIERMIDQFPGDQQEQIRLMLADTLRAVISQVLCRRTGGGRVAAREVLLVTPAVANLVRERKTFQVPSVMQTSRKQGMSLMSDALVDLVTAGHIEPSEAYRRAVDKPAMLLALRTAGYEVATLDTASGSDARTRPTPRTAPVTRPTPAWSSAIGGRSTGTAA
ncbi:MAG: PilT/PilU family type 4a pilus ATPase [Gemmatimonadaceae bacterium]|jgi:twitching motility protein PilT|nr:PilT/PilU family type 4a pilus ATPase [Gemmatimonadaceae bacterium]